MADPSDESVSTEAALLRRSVYSLGTGPSNTSRMYDRIRRLYKSYHKKGISAVSARKPKSGFLNMEASEYSHFNSNDIEMGGFFRSKSIDMANRRTFSQGNERDGSEGYTIDPCGNFGYSNQSRDFDIFDSSSSGLSNSRNSYIDGLYGGANRSMKKRNNYDFTAMLLRKSCNYLHLKLGKFVSLCRNNLKVFYKKLKDDVSSVGFRNDAVGNLLKSCAWSTHCYAMPNFNSNNSLELSNNNSLELSNNNSLELSNNNSLKFSNNNSLKFSNNNSLKFSNNDSLEFSNNDSLEFSKNNNSLKFSKNNNSLKISKNNNSLKISNNDSLEDCNLTLRDGDCDSFEDSKECEEECESSNVELPSNNEQMGVEGDVVKDGENLVDSFFTMSLKMRKKEINKMMEIIETQKAREERLNNILKSLPEEPLKKSYDIIPQEGEEGHDIWGLSQKVKADPEAEYLKVLFMNNDIPALNNLDSFGDLGNVLNVIRNGRDSEVLIEKFGIEMTRSTISCLDGPHWLNDEVINFYMQMIQERNDLFLKNNIKNVPDCYCFNTFFFDALCGGDAPNVDYNYKSVARWTLRKKVNVFEKDILLIPVHVYKAHWSLGVVEMRKKWRSIMLYDSLGGSNKLWFENIKKWLQDEHEDKFRTPLESIYDWKWRENCKSEPYAPQQNNGHDCGVFLCQYAECIAASRKFDFSQAKISQIRIKMAQQILKGSIYDL